MEALQALDDVFAGFKKDLTKVDDANFKGHCYGCKEPITDSHFLKAHNEVYHVGHFKCAHCSKTFRADDPFIVNEAKPYCVSDYEDLFLPKCDSCKEAVKDQVVDALGKKFHVQCFTCTVCKLPIEAQFYEKDNEYYCEQDYVEKFLPTCHRCSQKIKPPNEGENRASTIIGVEIRGEQRKYHGDCFVCTACSKPLPNLKAYPFESDIYCKEHWHAAIEAASASIVKAAMQSQSMRDAEPEQPAQTLDTNPQASMRTLMDKHTAASGSRNQLAQQAASPVHAVDETAQHVAASSPMISTRSKDNLARPQSTQRLDSRSGENLTKEPSLPQLPRKSAGDLAKGPSASNPNLTRSANSLVKPVASNPQLFAKVGSGSVRQEDVGSHPQLATRSSDALAKSVAVASHPALASKSRDTLAKSGASIPSLASKAKSGDALAMSGGVLAKSSNVLAKSGDVLAKPSGSNPSLTTKSKSGDGLAKAPTGSNPHLPAERHDQHEKVQDAVEETMVEEIAAEVREGVQEQ